MHRNGMFTPFAVLPLHNGKAPRWLFNRMVKLADCIIDLIIKEYGVKGLLHRLSDPWFFQSLSCVLGYDWHSSGTTTVTCGALKEAVDPEVDGIAIAGGKGRASRNTPKEIEEYGLKFGLTSSRIEELKYSSRMAAKVDNSLIQDGYTLYHHNFIFDEHGDWIVIQQGMNDRERNARRYHWPINHKSLIEEPKKRILCNTRSPRVLDMTSSKSEENRRICLDLIKDDPRRLENLFRRPPPGSQALLDDYFGGRVLRKSLIMPRKVNWKALIAAYEFQPRTYEELIGISGLGSATIRGLALVAELVYGEAPSWRDPVRFSFAFGGKDGVPFPVDKRAMDGAIGVLRQGILASKVKESEKIEALQRLRRCVPEIPKARLRA
ncbi:DUF763 domain-containing protein [Candidatus Bathyarchaeota archaeon]|nr:DUF763 domain-containing protein [Candidatus Bathyarchaeota archaeon]MBS7631367.1 DUF763 domain-containing protein [Candidatus Bathyarchaeota archaeon]